MWSTAQYRQLVRASGWYDLIVTAAFVTPWSFLALHGLMQQWSQALNLPGELPPFAPMHLLMVNLMGSIVCVWSVLRIRDPQLTFDATTPPAGCCSPPGRSTPWPTAARP